MIKKKYKLKRKEFEIVFKKGKRWNDDLFYYVFLESDEEKFSVVISKKKIKKAVERNKIKRIIFDKIKDRKKFFKNLNLIIFLKKPIKKEESSLFLKETDKKLDFFLKKYKISGNWQVKKESKE